MVLAPAQAYLCPVRRLGIRIQRRQSNRFAFDAQASLLCSSGKRKNETPERAGASSKAEYWLATPRDKIPTYPASVLRSSLQGPPNRIGVVDDLLLAVPGQDRGIARGTESQKCLLIGCVLATCRLNLDALPVRTFPQQP